MLMMKKEFDENARFFDCSPTEEAAWSSGLRRYRSYPSTSLRSCEPEFKSGSGLGQADFIGDWDNVLATYATLPALWSMIL